MVAIQARFPSWQYVALSQVPLIFSNTCHRLIANHCVHVRNRFLSILSLRKGSADEDIDALLCSLATIFDHHIDSTTKSATSISRPCAQSFPSSISRLTRLRNDKIAQVQTPPVRVFSKCWPMQMAVIKILRRFHFSWPPSFFSTVYDNSGRTVKEATGAQLTAQGFSARLEPVIVLQWYSTWFHR